MKWAIIIKGQQDIDVLFTLFYQSMQVDEDNWDEVTGYFYRMFPPLRLELLPTLKSIEAQTKKTVDEGHKTTLAQMAISHWLVVIYGICHCTYCRYHFLGIYANICIPKQKNTRLALFTHRNPNPILSVNNLGEVVFSNPACERFIVLRWLSS